MYNVDEEWEWYISELYTKLLKGNNKCNLDTVVELGPGFRHKIALALKNIEFKGTIYIIESNKKALDYVTNKYSEILRDANVIGINKDFVDSIDDLPKHIDLFMANHSIDDVLIEEYLNNKDKEIAFNNTKESKDKLLENWNKLTSDFYSLEKVKNIVYLKFVRFFESINFDYIIMSQYKSNEYFFNNENISNATREIFNRLKEFTSSNDKKINDILDYYVKEDDVRFKEKELLNNTQSYKNWIVGNYIKQPVFSLPFSLDLMGDECFINRKIYKRKELLKPLYINKKLYEEIFKKEYNFKEAKELLSKCFSITLNKDIASNEELYSDAFIDFQSDASDIALNGNKGSGRAYYFGDNYNLKGEYTPLVTSKDPEYNNGKLPLSSAIHEAMISNVINSYKDDSCFETLAIFDNGEKFKFIYEDMIMPCSVMIRVIKDYDLYRFSHRFVNKIPYKKEELISISKDLGVMEGNKFVDRLLHGAWSVGNLSIKSNMIDFDTAFYGNGRNPRWSFTNKYKTNYFGYEYLGQMMVIESIVNSELNIDNVNLEQLKEIILQERENEINKRFITLMGFDISLYGKYKEKIDELAKEFERLSRVSFANYELFDVTKCESEKCYLFDFSRFFRYYPILNKKDSIMADYLLLILNSKASLIESKEKEEVKQVIDNYFNDILVKDMFGYLSFVNEVKEFIAEYSSLYDLIIDNENINESNVIRNAFLINTRKRYLDYDEALRFELLKLYEDNLITEENISDIINMAIASCVEDNKNVLDLVIFKEGYFYISLDENDEYHYEFKLYNKELINNDIKLFIDNKEIDINVRIENDYFVIESDTYSLLDMKEYNDIKYVELFENESKVDLHPIGLETKKYYKEVK